MTRRTLAVLATASAAYLVAFLLAALFPPEGQADIAVVFGNQVLDDGNPSARLQARLQAAELAYRKHLVPLVLVSGGRGASGWDEASVMRQALLKAGLPPDAVLADDAGVDTSATVRDAMRIVHARSLRRVMVVTQYFHGPRCRLAFRRAGARVVVATYPRFVELRDVYSLARELVALPVEAMRS